MDDADFELPDWAEVRIAEVAKTARKGKRGTSARVDWADLITQAMSDLSAQYSGQVPMAKVKEWAQEQGASKGGAIDRRHNGLNPDHTDYMKGGKDEVLATAGIGAVTQNGVEILHRERHLGR